MKLPPILTKRRLVTALLSVCLGLFIIMAATGTWIYTVTSAQRAERAAINARGFAHIPADPRWDLKKNMLWGYYFTNQSRWPLSLGSGVLGMFGFRFVDLSWDDDKHFWWLHMERTRIHDLDSLSITDVRLARFARVSGLSTYDGWDVGPAE